MLDSDDEKVIKEAKEVGAVFVTWDRVVRLAAGGITPYEALDQAIAAGTGTSEAQAEASRLRKLTPAELSSVERFSQHIEVDRGFAKLIRQLRTEKDYSWRSIARFYSEVWHAPWGGNQIVGMVICEKAAKLLGEDFLQPPWN